MKQSLFKWAAISAITASFVSCAYDPYYYGGGPGPDYGGPVAVGGITATLVATSDSRWGYDSSRYCYYDYQRRSYYDPYLYGYYPSYYVPPIVVGCPHPYGWRPGYGVCPSPRGVRYSYLSNYQNRAVLLRQRNYDWARQVRQTQNGRFDRNPAYWQNNRPGSGNRPGTGNNWQGGNRPGAGNNWQGGNRPGTGNNWQNNRPGGQNPVRPGSGWQQGGNRPVTGGSWQGNQGGNRPGGNPSWQGGNRPGASNPSWQGGNRPGWQQGNPTIRPPQTRPPIGPSARPLPQRPQRQQSQQPQNRYIPINNNSGFQGGQRPQINRPSQVQPAPRQQQQQQSQGQGQGRQGWQDRENGRRGR